MYHKISKIDDDDIIKSDDESGGCCTDWLCWYIGWTKCVTSTFYNQKKIQNWEKIRTNITNYLSEIKQNTSQLNEDIIREHDNLTKLSSKITEFHNNFDVKNSSAPIESILKISYNNSNKKYHILCNRLEQLIDLEIKWENVLNLINAQKIKTPKDLESFVRNYKKLKTNTNNQLDDFNDIMRDIFIDNQIEAENGIPDDHESSYLDHVKRKINSKKKNKITAYDKLIENIHKDQLPNKKENQLSDDEIVPIKNYETNKDVIIPINN